MQNAETTINRREFDENGSLMSLLVNDINLMFMDQKGMCFYTDISIYYLSRLWFIPSRLSNVFGTT